MIKFLFLKELPVNKFISTTYIENRFMGMGRGEERVKCMERVTWKLTLPYVKIDSQWGICCLAQETQTGALY